MTLFAMFMIMTAQIKYPPAPMFIAHYDSAQACAADLPRFQRSAMQGYAYVCEQMQVPGWQPSNP